MNVVQATSYIKETAISATLSPQGNSILSTGAGPSLVEFDTYLKFRGDHSLSIEYITTGTLYLAVSLNDICIFPQVTLQPTSTFPSKFQIGNFRTTFDDRKVRIRFETLVGIWLPQIFSVIIEPSSSAPPIELNQPPSYSVSMYPPTQAAYPPQGATFPPQGATYPPQGATYPPQGATYPPQGATYPPQGATYPPQGATYPPQGATYPPPQQQTPPPQTNKVVVKATKYSRGTACTKDMGYGDVITSNGVLKATAEYDISLTPGKYKLELKFASGERRGVRVYLNGAILQKNAIDFTTGGYFLANLYTFKVADINWNGGVLSIKIEPEGTYLPHIHELIFTKE